MSICTDGIFSFKPFNEKNVIPRTESEIIELLLMDKTGGESPNMLQKKLRYIEREWALMPSDDLSIVRTILK